MIKRLPLVFSFLLFSVNLQAREPIETTVKRVVDGDTIEIANGEKVRLIGVDAPEFKDHQRNSTNAKRLGINFKYYESFSPKAKKFLKDLVEGKKVRLEFDPINEKIEHKGYYGRWLAYLYDIETYENPIDILSPLGYVIEIGNEIFVNATIIKSGYGIAFRRYKFKHMEKFLKYEKEAKEKGRGIWGK